MARDYAAEYAASRTPERRRANIMRKRARRLMIKQHGEAALRGKEVDHVNLHPTDNRRSNLSIKTVHANRAKQPKHK